MKFVLALSFCAVLFCHASEAGELDGAWELISGEYLDDQDTITRYKDLGMESIKVISGSHFSFTSMKGEKFWASGTGTYQLINGKYIERLQYNSFGEKRGDIFTFDAKIEGNTWYNSRWDGEKRVEYEVWQKIE